VIPIAIGAWNPVVSSSINVALSVVFFVYVAYYRPFKASALNRLMLYGIGNTIFCVYGAGVVTFTDDESDSTTTRNYLALPLCWLLGYAAFEGLWNGCRKGQDGAEVMKFNNPLTTSD
jgi:hypothetical protein